MDTVPTWLFRRVNAQTWEISLEGNPQNQNLGSSALVVLICVGPGCIPPQSEFFGRVPWTNGWFANSSIQHMADSPLANRDLAMIPEERQGLSRWVSRETTRLGSAWGEGYGIILVLLNSLLNVSLSNSVDPRVWFGTCFRKGCTALFRVISLSPHQQSKYSMSLLQILNANSSLRTHSSIVSKSKFEISQ